MNWFRVLFVLWNVVVLGVGIWVAAFSDVGYSGKDVFRTTQEYIEFKECIGREGVGIDEMVVLSSEPPIVVKYSVIVERGIEFPYGSGSLAGNIVASIFIIAASGLGFWASVKVIE